MKRIILFDGECHFCDSSVQFIIKRDPKGVFYFSSLQSDAGKELLKKYGVSEDVETMFLIDEEKVYDKSSAALRICRHLKGFWKLCYGLIIIPKPIRDVVYDVIAKNRYRWFGKKESCTLPPPSVRKRFL